MQQTSVQLDTTVLEDLKAAYPGMSTSLIIRAALQYMLSKLPEIQRGIRVGDKP